jgi:hypothetical protein
MVDRLSWLALIAAVTFSAAIILFGSGPKAAETGQPRADHAAACTQWGC